jgi:hypothetical protein
MMDIEGRSLREYLNWISRERGFTLRFADPGTAGKADAIILDGSVEGLTLEESLAAVLATCNLSHRVEGEILIVE